MHVAFDLVIVPILALALLVAIPAQLACSTSKQSFAVVLVAVLAAVSHTEI